MSGKNCMRLADILGLPVNFCQILLYLVYLLTFVKYYSTFNGVAGEK